MICGAPRIARGGPLRLLPRYGSGGYYDPMRPAAMQLRVDVPAEASSMEVTYTVAVIPEPGWEPVADVHVLVQTGSPVAFSYAVDAEGRTTVEAEPDQHIASVNEGRFTLALGPGDSAADLDAGRPVYLAFFNQGLHVALIDDVEVRFEVDADASDSTDGADGTDGATGTGSTGAEDAADADAAAGGCRTGGPGSAWLGLLLLLGIRRRAGLVL